MADPDDSFVETLLVCIDDQRCSEHQRAEQ